MAWEAIQQTISLDAAADLSAKLFYAISTDSSGKAAIATAAKNCDGFLQNKPTAGQAADVAIFGVTKVQTSGAVTAGALMEVDASGNLKSIASGTAVAKALETCTGAAIITALILKSNAVYA